MKEFSEQLEYFKKENTAKDNEITFLEKKLKEANEEEKVCFLLFFFLVRQPAPKYCLCKAW